HLPRGSTGEEGVATACRKDQSQGLGDRRIGLMKRNLNSGCTRYRLALDLLRVHRLYRPSVSILLPLRGAQSVEDSLPPSVADRGKVAFDCLHRRSAHGVDSFTVQREEPFDLVGQSADIASWRDVSVLSLFDQVSGTVSDVVHDGNAACPHRLHH